MSIKITPKRLSRIIKEEIEKIKEGSGSPKHMTSSVDNVAEPFDFDGVSNEIATVVSDIIERELANGVDADFLTDCVEDGVQYALENSITAPRGSRVGGSREEPGFGRSQRHPWDR